MPSRIADPKESADQQSPSSLLAPLPRQHPRHRATRSVRHLSGLSNARPLLLWNPLRVFLDSVFTSPSLRQPPFGLLTHHQSRRTYSLSRPPAYSSISLASPPHNYSTTLLFGCLKRHATATAITTYAFLICNVTPLTNITSGHIHTCPNIYLRVASQIPRTKQTTSYDFSTASLNTITLHG